MSTLQRPMMLSKIHRATVTQADLSYVGSITIDEELMKAADLLPNQQVDVLDITNGERITTYAIPGPRGARDIKINGAAAHLVSVGDKVIVIAYGLMSDAEAHQHTPIVVVVDERNDVVEHPVAAEAL
jgi:aspartate 1-decarboxylase